MARRAAVAFGLALTSFGLIWGGVAVDVWMANLPSVDTPCGVGCIQGHTNPLDQRWVGVVLVTLGLVLLVFAWQADRRPAARPRQGWKPVWSWGAPLLWLLFIPLIAGPATYLIAANNAYDRSCHVSFGWFSGGSDCPAYVFIRSVVLPGLLNLVPVWWLRRNDGGRGWIAAVVASLLGVGGLATSLFVFQSLGPEISWDFGFFLPNLPPIQQAGLPFGVVLWLATIIALLVIAKLQLSPEPASAAAV